MLRCARFVLAMLVVLSVAGVRPAAAFASRGFVEPPTVSVGDSDGDGLPEASASGVAGGPCACRCPVIRGDAGASAGGQVLTAGTGTALVVCGTRLAAAVNPNPPDVVVVPRLSGRLIFDPGGLGRGGPGG